jgi:hypothetical protein
LKNSKEDPEASVESIIKRKKTYRNWETQSMRKIVFFLYCFVVLLHELKLKKSLRTLLRVDFPWKVQIKNPQSVLSAYTYDPVMDRYVYTNTVDFN